jgi:hypothetical protein
MANAPKPPTQPTETRSIKTEVPRPPPAPVPPKR